MMASLVKMAVFSQPKDRMAIAKHNSGGSDNMLQLMQMAVTDKDGDAWSIDKLAADLSE